MEKIRSIRGMNDLLPEQMAIWQYVELSMAQIAALYGYQEIRTPIVEHTSLFKRSIGEATDIVEKEMYSFEDKGGDRLTLRPENTASCMRAGIEHGLFHNQKQKLWYMGPMFRHERPQKGRYRQFHQFGCEAIGWTGPDLDAELIQLTARLWKKLGLKHLSLQINSIGTASERQCYRNKLIEYLSGFKQALDVDSQRRLLTNPLRIFDSKVETTQEIMVNAPLLKDYLSNESKLHFEKLCQLLDEADINYQLNSRLVRGLDYYSLTVFEWVTDKLGAQNAICAGGRYDGLIEQLGGKPTPGIGFAIGIERLVELVKLIDHLPVLDHLQVYLLTDNSDIAQKRGCLLAEQLRDEDVKILVHYGAGSIKSKFKKADQSGADLAIMIGEDETKANQVALKPLRGQGGQTQSVYLDQLDQALLAQIKNLITSKLT